MAHALLSNDYMGRKAGELITNITDREADTIVRLGLGEKLAEEPTKPEPKAKGEKSAE